MQPKKNRRVTFGCLVETRLEERGSSSSSNSRVGVLGAAASHAGVPIIMRTSTYVCTFTRCNKKHITYNSTT